MQACLMSPKKLIVVQSITGYTYYTTALNLPQLPTNYIFRCGPLRILSYTRRLASWTFLHLHLRIKNLPNFNPHKLFGIKHRERKWMCFETVGQCTTKTILKQSSTCHSYDCSYDIDLISSLAKIIIRNNRKLDILS